MPVLKETPPKPTSKRAALKHRIWKALEKLRKPEIKFAFKVGVGAALLALPAFRERWREGFIHWRGEWALLSYFVVMANSVGATTSTGFWRILGTSLGAFAAIVLYHSLLFELLGTKGRWELCPANPYVLSIVGALFSWGCFYLIANTANWQPFGRFILLTYNLVSITSFASS